MTTLSTRLATNTTMSESTSNAQHTLKEKSKRPQLSCNSCRTRKVKCDRVQPCTACSLHQIADQCQYDLTESERHPILQAEALREKDKEIARLRLEVLALGGSSTRSESHGHDFDHRKRRKSGFNVRSGKRPPNLCQKKPGHDQTVDSLYFGAPSLSSVIQELADLTLRSQIGNLSHSPPQSCGGNTVQDPASFPFPALWLAKDGVTCLPALIPPKEEVFSYLDSFQKRVQGCSFPHVPEECTLAETERFLANVERNSEFHPDMLALLFATMAQGLQHGLFDRCGGQWLIGSREVESKKGDVFIAAAMQALRQGSFMSRPTLLTVQTLVMIGPYLTDSGKLLDAWALFGITIRLAQAIGLHRDPSHLVPKPPPEEANTRKNLWWWILHMDQQYSITLGRPLGISNLGDCPTPMLLRADPVIDSLSNYHSKFTVVARRILSAAYLCNAQIDQFTDELLALQNTLPVSLRFSGSWLDKDAIIPAWPLNAQAASMYQKTHNFIISLNRQRVDDNSMDTACSSPEATSLTDSYHGMSRGRDRVLESCHEILVAFQFFNDRVRVGLVCWTICQQAFNAAHILIMAMLEYNAMEFFPIVQQTYNAFSEINQLGIHELAGAALERLDIMVDNLKTRSEPIEGVMSKHGMALLEYAQQQDIDRRRFSPLRFNMVDHSQAGNEGYEASQSSCSDVPTAKPAKKQKPNANDQKVKVTAKKGQRKDGTSARRSSSGRWPREHTQQLSLMNAFSTPPTPKHTYHNSELSAVDIQSTLPPGSQCSSSSGARVSSSHGLHTAPPGTTTFNLAEPKPWLYATHSPRSTSAYPPTATSSVSAPSSYHHSSFNHNRQAVRVPNSMNSSRPPSLHLASHHSSASTYPNSFASSLQTASSGLQTPSASHPVSPSLSQNQQYCIGQPQTQPHSPVWSMGFDGSMECSEISMGIATTQPPCVQMSGEERAWWGQGWNGQ